MHKSIAADGAGGINATIANSQINGNRQDGIIAVTPGGGALLTFGNNEVQATGTNGAFSASVGLQ